MVMTLDNSSFVALKILTYANINSPVKPDDILLTKTFCRRKGLMVYGASYHYKKC